MNHDKFDEVLAKSFLNGKRYLIRGTKEWDDREDARRKHGNICISFGTISQSVATNGRSSLIRA